MKNSKGRQATPEELLSTILRFIAARFYQGEAKAFAQDRARLLKWVVLKPAAWLDDRGMTIHPDDYRKLFVDPAEGILMIALQHGNTDGVKYLPAWLGKAVESRLRIQGDRLYEMAKNYERRQASVLVDRVAAALGGVAAGRAPDPVRQLARSADLLRQPKRAGRKLAVTEQLTLL